MMSSQCELLHQHVLCVHGGFNTTGQEKSSLFELLVMWVVSFQSCLYLNSTQRESSGVTFAL